MSTRSPGGHTAALVGGGTEVGVRRRLVLTVAIGLCLLAGGLLVVATPAAADAINVTHTTGLAESPGDVDVRTRLAIPDGITSLRVVVDENASVYETTGFTRVDDRTYEWTRSTDRPYLRYTLPGNVSVRRGGERAHLYAVTEEWAIVRSPTVTLRWTGTDVPVERSYAVAGDGVAGRTITYLGPHRVYTRDGPQRFSLVVPRAADMAAEPARILDSLEHASRRLDFGTRDPTVLFIVAPTDTVEWAATGLTRGEANVWVRDVEPLDSAANTWIHEYVHTRQSFTTTESTRWINEGMAVYYAALLPYEQDRITYEAFRDRLALGTRDRYADVRLVDPSTWRDNDGNYAKGGLVVGYLDWRIRTDGSASIEDAIARFDDGELTQEAFLSAIEAVGGTDVRTAAERYTETTDAPSTWSRGEHVAAFGGADIRYRFESFAIDGPYRSTTTTGTPSLVTGETLTATVVVRNAGTEAGEYTAQFRVDGRTVATRTGRLAAGETTRLSFDRHFDSPGRYALSVDTATATVTVSEPARVEVTELTAIPTTPARSEPVTLRATVAATADRPAAGEVRFALDGRTVATETVRFVGSTTVETTVVIDEPGRHTVGAGSRTVRVEVRTATTTAVDGPTAAGDPPGERPATPTPGSGAGVGPTVAAVAVIVAALVHRRRSR